MVSHIQGKIIVIDGNDGSGKATQSAALATRLEQEGIQVLFLSFPRYKTSMAGAFIGELLTGVHGDISSLSPQLMSLPYALDRAGAVAEIRDALAEGRAVVLDRFTSSNQIHQGGKIEDEDARIAYLEWLSRLEHEELGIPRPDHVVYLKVPVAMSVDLLREKRATKNASLEDGALDQVESDRIYLERSHETANWLAQRERNWSMIECTDEVGAMRSREEIAEDIFSCVMTRFAS